MRPDDVGPGRPPLPAEAGATERTLYEVYDVQTGIVDVTAADWRTTAESVRGLSAEVRGIVSALRGAPDAWTGPAAEAAYATLGKLAANLDVHAEDIDRIEAGLTSAHDSVTTARADYVNRVRTLSLDVDPADYQRRDPAAPQLPREDAMVPDRQAYDSAVAEAKAAREQEAAAVLATFTDSMTTAAKKLPVEPAQQTPVSEGSTSGGGGGGSTGGGGGVPSGTTYHPPSGTTGVWVSQPTGGGDDTTSTTDTGDDGGRGDGTGTSTWPPPVVGPSPVLDGPVDGSLGPVGAGAPSSTGGPVPAGGVGPGGAAAGAGGVLAGGGAAALLGRGGMPGGVPGRLPAAFGGGSGAAGRPGGAAASGRSSVLGAGGQGGTGRGTGGRGGTGSARTGRYGVPKLGERAAGRSALAGGGGAGGRGQKGDRDDAVDVEHLTTEDEATWFEDADEATPPVWD